MRVCLSEPVLLVYSSPPFIDSRRDGLHAREITEVVPSSPNRGRTIDGSCYRALWGMAPSVVVVLGNLLTVLGTCLCPMVPVDGMAVAVGHAVLRIWRGGAPRVLPMAASSRSVAVLCSRVAVHIR